MPKTLAYLIIIEQHFIKPSQITKSYSSAGVKHRAHTKRSGMTIPAYGFQAEVLGSKLC
jgi:hypothetical protein